MTTGSEHGKAPAGDLTHLHGLTKEEWCIRLDGYHERLRLTVPGFEGYGEGPAISNTGWDAWQSYFNDGYTPEAALDEDRTYWED